jgi:hypothetical protein
MGFDWTCCWGTFKATHGVTAPMCMHPGKDVVSGSIVSTGIITIAGNDMMEAATLYGSGGDR